MAIFAQGPSYQKYSGVGTAPTAVFNTRGSGGTAIGSSVTVHNPTIVNAGSVTLYVGGGTIATVFGGTATQINLINNGVAIPPGGQMVIFGTAVTASTAYANVFDLVGCTAGSGTTVFVEGGYATQTIIS